MLTWETYQTIIKPNKNKATSGNFPTKTLKTIARDICVPLTGCIKSAILNVVFPDGIKFRKKNDPDNKANYRQTTVLPSLFKVYETKSTKQSSFLIYVDFVRGIVHSILYLTYYLTGKIA